MIFSDVMGKRDSKAEQDELVSSNHINAKGKVCPGGWIRSFMSLARGGFLYACVIGDAQAAKRQNDYKWERSCHQTLVQQKPILMQEYI